MDLAAFYPFVPLRPISITNNTAEFKLQYLWDKIITSNNESSAFPPLLGALKSSAIESFEIFSDELPVGHLKYIHSVGAVAKVEWEMVPDAGGGGHAFTGIFATGSKQALLRISKAVDLPIGRITPGLALKILLDGVVSANLLALISLQGDTDHDIFYRNYTNHVPLPVPPIAPHIFTLKAKFSTASSCPNMLGLSELSQYNMTPKDDAITPYEVVFVPNPMITFPSTEYDLLTLLDLLEGIPNGTVLFEIYARHNPGEDANIPLGTIRMLTPFTRSKFGDDTLFFRHGYMEDDIALNPWWLNMTDIPKSCFNPNFSPNITRPYLQDSARQMSETNCPFRAILNRVEANPEINNVTDPVSKSCRSEYNASYQPTGLNGAAVAYLKERDRVLHSAAEESDTSFLRGGGTVGVCTFTLNNISLYCDIRLKTLPEAQGMRDSCVENGVFYTTDRTTTVCDVSYAGFAYKVNLVQDYLSMCIPESCTKQEAAHLMRELGVEIRAFEDGIAWQTDGLFDFMCDAVLTNLSILEGANKEDFNKNNVNSGAITTIKGSRVLAIALAVSWLFTGL